MSPVRDSSLRERSKTNSSTNMIGTYIIKMMMYYFMFFLQLEHVAHYMKAKEQGIIQSKQTNKTTSLTEKQASNKTDNTKTTAVNKQKT